jgi:hypothetical protein
MKPAAAPAYKITMQYRSGNALVYELESATGVALDVHVSSGATPERADAWHVAAHSSRRADPIVISESAATRAEALRKVANGWTAQASELGLTTFDWDAVTKLLLSVRAI